MYKRTKNDHLCNAFRGDSKSYKLFEGPPIGIFTKEYMEKEPKGIEGTTLCLCRFKLCVLRKTETMLKYLTV